MRATLKTAKETYLKDPGTLNWFIMQDPKDSAAWSIVERYEDEAVIILFQIKGVRSPFIYP
jgi:quinol monooxygenase YgiN